MAVMVCLVECRVNWMFGNISIFKGFEGATCFIRHLIFVCLLPNNIKI